MILQEIIKHYNPTAKISTTALPYYDIRYIIDTYIAEVTINNSIQKSSTTNVKAQSGNSQAANHTSSNTAFDTISIKDISNIVNN